MAATCLQILSVVGVLLTSASSSSCVITMNFTGCSNRSLTPDGFLARHPHLGMNRTLLSCISEIFVQQVKIYDYDEKQVMSNSEFVTSRFDIHTDLKKSHAK